MIAGTKAETVIAIIEKIPLKQRNLVTEITLDMAGNMVGSTGVPAPTTTTTEEAAEKCMLLAV